jgi:hypothetical protein
MITRRPPYPKIAHFRAAQKCSPQYVEIDRPIFSGREHSMDDKWRVSRVELLEGGLLYGFVLYDERGKPIVSFGYSDRAKAKLGRNHVAAALKDAEQVLGR